MAVHDHSHKCYTDQSESKEMYVCCWSHFNWSRCCLKQAKFKNILNQSKKTNFFSKINRSSSWDSKECPIPMIIWNTAFY